MKLTTDTFIAIIIALTIIDILYTGYGAFYGGGGAELNPLFNWATNPTVFVIAVVIGKIVGIGTVLYLLRWVESRDATLSHRLCCYTGAVYACMLAGVIGVNIAYILAGG